LLWLLGYLDPLLSSNLCVLSASSFLDDITTGFKLAISELYFQILFCFHYTFGIICFILMPAMLSG
jgi:hypothetical protein